MALEVSETSFLPIAPIEPSIEPIRTRRAPTRLRLLSPSGFRRSGSIGAKKAIPATVIRGVVARDNADSGCLDVVKCFCKT